MSEDKDKASTSSWHGGKGSLTRKGSNHRAYADNWETIFGKKNENEKENALQPAGQNTQERPAGQSDKQNNKS